MAAIAVFVINDTSGLCDRLARLAEPAEFEFKTLTTLAACRDAELPASGCCVVIDLSPDDLADPDQREELAALCAKLPVLVLSDDDIPSAVQAVRQGAADVLRKPVREDRVLAAISRILGYAADPELHC